MEQQKRICVDLQKRLWEDHFCGFRGGALAYFTHKFGPPQSATEDLRDDDMKVQQSVYLTDQLRRRNHRRLREIRRIVSSQPPLQCAALAVEAPGDEAEAERLTSLFHWDGGTQRTYQHHWSRAKLKAACS